jgi:hypothetical protein
MHKGRKRVRLIAACLLAARKLALLDKPCPAMETAIADGHSAASLRPVDLCGQNVADQLPETVRPMGEPDQAFDILLIRVCETASIREKRMPAKHVASVPSRTNPRFVTRSDRRIRKEF